MRWWEWLLLTPAIIWGPVVVAVARLKPRVNPCGEGKGQQPASGETCGDQSDQDKEPGRLDDADERRDLTDIDDADRARYEPPHGSRGDVSREVGRDVTRDEQDGQHGRESRRGELVVHRAPSVDGDNGHD